MELHNIGNAESSLKYLQQMW